MFAKVHSCAVIGLNVELLHFEVASGLEKVTVVG